MVNYGKHKMRIVEYVFKDLDCKTDTIVETRRYRIFSWWHWICGWRELDRRDYDDEYRTRGFYNLEDALAYCAVRMKRWKERLEEEDAKKRRKKDLRTTKKVVKEWTLNDF